MKQCINCFKETDSTQEKCRNCGYPMYEEKERDPEYPRALPFASILNGKYITGRVLGQGGFGITYIAQDFKTKELVAIKEYFPGDVSTRSDYIHLRPRSRREEDSYKRGLDRFIREANKVKALSDISHIVNIHEAWPENNTAYFSMDFLQGLNFYEYISKKGGRIPWRKARDILLPVMNALLSNTLYSEKVFHHRKQRITVGCLKNAAV